MVIGCPGRISEDVQHTDVSVGPYPFITCEFGFSSLSRAISVDGKASPPTWYAFSAAMGSRISGTSRRLERYDGVHTMDSVWYFVISFASSMGLCISSSVAMHSVTPLQSVTKRSVMDMSKEIEVTDSAVLISCVCQ